MKRYTAKFINRDTVHSLSVNFNRNYNESKDITKLARVALSEICINPDSYKLLSITEK